MRPLEIHDLGRMRYAQALEVQRELVEQRKRGEGCDTLLFVEHPHVVTLGRNGKEKNLLAGHHVLERAGIEFYETDRGGDVTYHGPGQLVGYPILDLREWKRDVHAYFSAVEQVLIDALAVLGIQAERIPVRGYEGVWVNGAKIAAIGIHISRWITSHGFALNIDTDLSYFKFIVPCGLTKPVCSLQSLGVAARHAEVAEAVINSFMGVFGYQVIAAQEARQPGGGLVNAPGPSRCRANT